MSGRTLQRLGAAPYATDAGVSDHELREDRRPGEAVRRAGHGEPGPRRVAAELVKAYDRLLWLEREAAASRGFSPR